MIKHIFHLADNEENKGKHKFYKIANLMERLTFNYRQYYAPDQYLTFDESMVSYKSRLNFKYYIPSKPTKWEMKLHSLNESETGYFMLLILEKL